MMFILMANKHYDGYDLQVEVCAFAHRDEAEREIDRLESQSYIHDECEVRRATYVIVEDRTDEPKRTGEAVDGSGAAAKPARAKAGRNRSPK